MGVNISDIVPAQAVELEHLTGRAIAIDAYNTIYQFLSSIRQQDGTLLMSPRGEVTSHLTGLLYRTAKLVEAGIRVVYVFDGIPPDGKLETVTKRAELRATAHKKWERARDAGRFEEARGYAQQSSKLTKPMVEQAKELLSALGIPFVQAPSEGEAQAALMAQRGDVWAVGSQDFDSILFGAPALVRNMTVSGRRKLPRKKVYVVVKPELIMLEDVLSEMGITREQLVDVGILIGTDYNPGVKGIGPKKALALVKGGKCAEEVFEKHGLDAGGIAPIRQIFLKPDVVTDYCLEWGLPDEEKAASFLCERHGFSQERVRKVVGAMHRAMDVKSTQARLDTWFGG